MAMSKPLTREESKAITRRRLIEAAGKILAERGHGGLSASAVAREAGVAQPTFYVHFRDKADLLRIIADEQVQALRQPLRDVRRRIAGAGFDAIRETYRIPLELWSKNPGYWRLYLQELSQQGSPIGAMARDLKQEFRRDLVDDLKELGLPSRTKADKERLAMIAEGILGLTEALAMGFVEGRFTDREAALDVLGEFTAGVLGIPTPGSSRRK